MITSTVLEVGKIPMILEDDRLALKTAVKTLTQVDKNRVRMVYIKNTLSLQTLMISEELLVQAKEMERVEILEGPRDFCFDKDGTLLDLR